VRAPEIQLVVDAASDAGTLYQQLYRQLREHILSGALTAGEALPSARTLAGDLGISRNTVEAALSQLVEEGFIVRQVGSGTRVSENVTEIAPFHRRRPRRSQSEPAVSKSEPTRCAVLPARGMLITRLGLELLDDDRTLGPSSRDLAEFPLEVWNRMAARRARRTSVTLLRNHDPAGLPDLRRQIAEHVRLARGLACTPEQVVIVSSTQQAIDLVARLVLDPGDPVAVEDPGYAAAWAALRVAGGTLRSVGIDEEGLMVSDLPTTNSPRLVYSTPSHQYPLGVTMSLARRLALLRWAATHQAWIIEDDYVCEFRYGARPLAALHALDRAERVIYLGTFNKVLFPGVRLAYAVVPGSLIDGMQAARRISSGPPPPFMQALVADFMASGQFAASLRQLRRSYAALRDELIAQTTRYWGSSVRLGPSQAGLHLVAHVAERIDDEALARRVHELPVGVAPLSRYYLARRRRSGLLIGFATADVATIAKFARRLAPELVNR
jgi:GntR family transcriptional regulator/MocR family aminotransferase